MKINTVLGSGDVSSNLSFRGYEIDIEAGRDQRTLLCKIKQASSQRDDTQIFILKLYKLIMVADSPFGKLFCNKTVSICISKGISYFSSMLSLSLSRAQRTQLALSL